MRQINGCPRARSVWTACDLSPLSSSRAQNQYHNPTASDAEKDFAAAIAEVKKDLKGVCVYCNHCLPCESEVNIPEVIRLLTMAEKGLTPAIKAAYAALPVKASDCTECGVCMERCPFDVDITGKMRQAAEVFGS